MDHELPFPENFMRERSVGDVLQSEFVGPLAVGTLIPE